MPLGKMLFHSAFLKTLNIRTIEIATGSSGTTLALCKLGRSSEGHGVRSRGEP